MKQTTRTEALAILAEGQAALAGLFTRLSDGDFVRPATIGGGDWSAKDLLGHLAFWEELAVEAIAAWRDGRRPTAVEIFAGGRAGIDDANARDQARNARESLATVRARAETARAAVRRAIEMLTDEEWQATVVGPGNRPETLGELLGGILGAPKRPFGHAFAHQPDLQAYVGTLGGRGAK